LNLSSCLLFGSFPHSKGSAERLKLRVRHFPVWNDWKKEKKRKRPKRLSKMEDSGVDVVEYPIDGSGQHVRLCMVRESSAGTLPQHMLLLNIV
jgi:hypothetical protein